MSRLKLSLCGCIGVMLTVLAAAVVFPVRARSRLRKSTARILEDLGSLAFQLLGEFCQVRAAIPLCNTGTGSISSQFQLLECPLGLTASVEGQLEGVILPWQFA